MSHKGDRWDIQFFSLIWEGKFLGNIETELVHHQSFNTRQQIIKRGTDGRLWHNRKHHVGYIKHSPRQSRQTYSGW